MLKSAVCYVLSLCCQLLLVGANNSAKMSSVPAKKLSAEWIERESSLSPQGVLWYNLLGAKQSRQVHDPSLHWKSDSFRFQVASDSQPQRQRHHASSGRSRRSLDPEENGEGVDIYLFDTGIAYEMEEFEGRAKFVGRDFVNPGGDGRDDHGHGTFTASLAAGKTVGIAKKSTIYSVKVLNKYKNGNSAAIMQGLAYVEELYLSNTTRRAIVLLPMVSPYHQQTNQLVERLVRNGLTVVTSAGNNADDACKYTPGSASGVINTGAVDERDAIWQFSVRWSFAFYYMKGSNYGRCVDLFAPGTNVYGSSMNPALGYIKLSGTSATAPQTAGVAAVILQAIPAATPEQVKQLIIAYSRKNVLDLDKVPTSLRSLTPNRLLAIPKHIHTSMGEDVKADKSDPITKLHDGFDAPTTAPWPNPTVVSVPTATHGTVHSTFDTQVGTGIDAPTPPTKSTTTTVTATLGESSTYADASVSSSVWPTTSRVSDDQISQRSTVDTAEEETSARAKSSQTWETSRSSASSSTPLAIRAVSSTSSSENPTKPAATTLEMSTEDTRTATGKDRTADPKTASPESRDQLGENKTQNSLLPTDKQKPSLSRGLDSIPVLPALHQQQVAQGQARIAVASVCAIQSAYEEMKNKEYAITYIHPISKVNGTCFSVIFTKVEPATLTNYRAHFNLHYSELEKLLTSRQISISNVTAVLGYMGSDGNRLYLLVSDDRKEQDLVLNGFLQSDYMKMQVIVRRQGYWMVTILLASDRVPGDANEVVPTMTAVYRSFRSTVHTLYYRNIRDVLIKQHIKYMWKRGFRTTYISTYMQRHEENSLFLVGFAMGSDNEQYSLAMLKQSRHLEDKMQTFVDAQSYPQTLTPFTIRSGRKLAYLATFSKQP